MAKRDNREIIELRDIALAVIRARGSFGIDPNDGVCYYDYHVESIRIRLQPPPVGATMPHWIDIWETVGSTETKVFGAHWFVGRPDEIEVEINRARPWLGALRQLAEPLCAGHFRSTPDSGHVAAPQ
jgi:hypothetical protein